MREFLLFQRPFPEIAHRQFEDILLPAVNACTQIVLGFLLLLLLCVIWLAFLDWRKRQQSKQTMVKRTPNPFNARTDSHAALVIKQDSIF
ncbi:MAG: hypothetical protein AB1757_05475 [Acidobacteriota bacterium]